MLKFSGVVSASVVGLSLTLAGHVPAFAQEDNPEDLPIPDEVVPTAPAPVAPVTPVPTVPSVPAVQTPVPPMPEGVGAGENITVPRAVWEQLLRDVEELKKTRAAASNSPAVAAPVAAAPVESAPETPGTAPGGRNYLLLPDISFILDSKSLASTDKRDDGRNSLGLEGEIGIQGYLYPGVKLDSFIVGNPGEDEPFNIEEGYLTFLGLRKGLNVQVGRKFAPFGRTGELHPHSWLYSRQILARQNLVAPENLVGNGVNFDYLLPTGSNFFARLSLGAFSAGEAAAGRINTADPSDPFEGAFPTRTGSALSRFYNARLWMGKSLSEQTEVEFGLSHAQGRASIDNLTGFDPNGGEIVQSAGGRVKLSGADISLRHFTGVGKRLLVRGEYFKYAPENLPTRSASGYYGLVSYRPNKFSDFGLLYDKTGFTNASGQEKALSLIYTKQFTEQFYVRLMGTHGSRPGDSSYNELRLQFTAGIGPHVHSLE